MRLVDGLEQPRSAVAMCGSGAGGSLGVADTISVDEALDALLQGMFSSAIESEDVDGVIGTVAIELAKEMCWLLAPVFESCLGVAGGDAGVEELMACVVADAIPFPPHNWQRNETWIARNTRWGRPNIAMLAQMATVAISGRAGKVRSSPNPLMNLRASPGDSVHLLPTPYFSSEVPLGFGSRRRHHPAEQVLHDALRTELNRIDFVSGTCKKSLLAYFARVWSLYLRSTEVALRSRLLKRLVRSSESVFLGAGSSIATRILARTARTEGVRVSRFDHGGDRQLYADSLIRESELADVDRFFTFGSQGAHKFANEIRTTFLGRIEGANVLSAGSMAMFQRRGPRPVVRGGPEGVLYVPNSLVGETRQFPFFKPNDAHYSQWQRSLLMALQSRFAVTYKPHPKGNQAHRAILKGCGIPAEAAPLTACLGKYKVFVVDMITTAFFELIAADCAIVYVDSPWRRRKCLDVQAIADAAFFVDVTLADGRWQVDEDALIAAVGLASREGPRNTAEFAGRYIEGSGGNGGGGQP